MASEDEGPSDSLELFTDPVCNIFAMVCFIVILLVVLSSLRKPEVRQAGREVARTGSAEMIDELGRRLSEIVRPEQQVQLEEIADLQRALARKRAVQREAERREDVMVDELMDSDKAAEAVAQLLPDLSREIDQLESALQDAQARSEISLALPREKKVGGADVAAMVLDQGHAYMVTRVPEVLASVPFCDFLKLLDTECIDAVRSRVDCADGSQTIVLRDGKGVDVRQPGWQNSTMWKRWLQALQSKPRVVVYLQVNPDSHSEFLALRRALQEAGIFYNVTPQRPPYRIVWIFGQPTAQ
jgi:hypothetical protein